MSEGPELKTARLRLRRWRPEDLASFAELNADPVVMEHFESGPVPRERSNEILGFGLKRFLSWLTTATTRTQSTLLA